MRKRFTKVQIATILLFIGWMIWEYYIWWWAQTQVGAIIRVDLILILPVMLFMTATSVYQVFKGKNKRL